MRVTTIKVPKPRAEIPYEVIVGNVGVAWTGISRTEALREYGGWVAISKNGHHRASGEPVTLLHGDDIVHEHRGDASEEE